MVTNDAAFFALNVGGGGGGGDQCAILLSQWFWSQGPGDTGGGGGALPFHIKSEVYEPITRKTCISMQCLVMG